MVEKSRNAKATIAIIESAISGKLYAAIILDGTPYKYWDLETLGPAGINFVKEIMRAYDLGYDLEAQFPTMVNGNKQIVPISYRIKDEPGVDISHNKTIMDKIAETCDNYTETASFYDEKDNNGLDIATSSASIVSSNNPPISNPEPVKESEPIKVHKVEPEDKPIPEPEPVQEQKPEPKPASPEPVTQPAPEPIKQPVVQQITPEPKVAPVVSAEVVYSSKPEPVLTAPVKEIIQEPVAPPAPVSAPEPAVISEPAPESAPKQSDNTWTCICGTVTSSNFCHECGAPKPKPQPPAEQWVCAHGHVNSGNSPVCPICGTAERLSEAPQRPKVWTCKNGHVNEITSKFCPVCGESNTGNRPAISNNPLPYLQQVPYNTPQEVPLVPEPTPEPESSSAANLLASYISNKRA